MCRRRWSIFATVLIAMLCSSGAIAVDIEAVPGFGGACKTGSWVPITVRLKNPTNENISGAIALVDPLTRQPSSQITPFDLPGSSEKRYTHYVLLAQPGGEITVRLVPGDGRLPEGNLQTKVQSTAIADNGTLVVAAGSPKANLNFLSGEKIRIWAPPYAPASPSGGAPAKQVNTIQTGLAKPADLPDRPLGYDGVDLLALSDFAPARADAKQLAAIKMWVAGGGTLVINGGANYQGLQNDFYSDLLPVRVTGATELPGLDSVGSEFHHQLQQGGVVVTAGKLLPGANTMITQNGVPIVSSKTYGLGRVFFLAFDYSSSPFKGWDGHGDMWKRIIYSANTRFPIASPASLAEDNYGTPQRPPSGHNHRKVYDRSYVAGFNPIASVASSFPAVTTPSFEIILCFLLGYLICLVPLNYFVFTKKRKELAWITTPAVILIFTLGAYGIGYGMKGGKLLLKTVAVVEAGPNTRYASTTTYSGLFSPARKDYEIEFQDPFAAVSETLPQNNQQPGNQFQLSTDDDTMIRMAETTTIPRLKMDMWATRSFRSESACDLGGTLTTDIRIDATSRKATGTIRNNTDYDLQDCMIIIGTDTVQVGKVRRKSLVSVNASMSKNGPPQPAPVPVPAPYPAGAPAPGPMPTPYAPAPRQPSDPSDETREKLRSQIMPYVTGDGGPALVGWADKTPVQVRLNNGRAAHQTANCFIFWLPEEGGLNP